MQLRDKVIFSLVLLLLNMRLHTIPYIVQTILHKLYIFFLLIEILYMRGTDTENINVVYCPTSEMLADFYTNPLQGALFKKFRDVIMGLLHTNTLRMSTTPETQMR